MSVGDSSSTTQFAIMRCHLCAKWRKKGFPWDYRGNHHIPDPLVSDDPSEQKGIISVFWAFFVWCLLYSFKYGLHKKNLFVSKWWSTGKKLKKGLWEDNYTSQNGPLSGHWRCRKGSQRKRQRSNISPTRIVSLGNTRRRTIWLHLVVRRLIFQSSDWLLPDSGCWVTSTRRIILHGWWQLCWNLSTNIQHMLFWTLTAHGRLDQYR